jgi:flagellar FliJ protein
LYPMTRSKRMQSVQHLAHNREQDAVRKLGESQQYLDAQQIKLQELRAYRDEYAKAFESSGGAGLDALRIQEYRAFLGRLNQAIQQQETVIAQCSARHEQTRRQWLATHSHSQAIDKVLERYRQQERKQEERKEQQELDERACRSFDD